MRRAETVHDAARRFAWWSSTPAGLAVLFAAGFLLRLLLARGGGFPYDMSSFAGWAQRLGERGPWDFYPAPGEDYFIDYPPGYLYVLWALGAAARAAGRGAPPVFWLKLAPAIADLGLAWVVAQLAGRLAPLGRRVPVRGAAAAVVLFNPAVIFVSAIWGQADSVFALLVAGSLLCFVGGRASFAREAGGMALLAGAVATKPQTMFVVPALIAVLVWRHLRSRIAETEGSPAQAAAAGVGRLVALGGVAVATGLALLAPFGLSQTIEIYTDAPSKYPYTSVFAFNFWGAAGFWRRDAPPEGFAVFGIPALYVGIVLFVAGAGLMLVKAWRALGDGEDEGRVLVFGGIAISLVGFAVLTRVHERYLFLAVALAAAFVAFRRLRIALVALSVLFFVNVYFPYVYYLRQERRPAPSLGGLFDVFYGTDINGAPMKFLSVTTAAVCVAIAWAGWRWLQQTGAGAADGRAHGAGDAGVFAPTAAISAVPGPLDEEPPEARGRPSQWRLGLHPIGRRRALFALGVFAVALLSRVAGLGHPPGMYFDEVYHARTGAEYLNGDEVYEWTHPPLAKEIIGFFIARLSGFGASEPVPFGGEARPRLIAAGGSGLAWTQPAAAGSVDVRRGVVDGDCALRPEGVPARLALTPDALAVSDERTFVAGRGRDGPVLVRLDGASEVWRAALDRPARAVAALDDTAFVVADDGTLTFVGADGKARAVAAKAQHVASSKREGEVWATFPDERRVASWNREGTRGGVVGVDGRPGALTIPDGADRVVVDVDGSKLAFVETESDRVDSDLDGGAELVGTVPETGLAWAVQGTDVRIIEPRGSSVLGRVELPITPQVLFADGVRHRLVAATSDELVCVDGRPAFAWRFGSAVAGAAMVAFVFLIALRLFGNLLAAGLAALFLTVDGLAFTIARIAMNDSYVTAFILAAWFCALSALFRWGGSVDTERDPADPVRWALPASVAWLAASGVCAGLALASKWVGLYVLVGIALLFVWDVVARGRDSIWFILGGPLRTTAMMAVLFGALPLAVYVASYVPYFSLGHSFGDLVGLQGDMYGYHANLTADHPFGSPWYGWPYGRRAVFLYLADHGTQRSEIWAMPNLVVFWGGAAAMVAVGVRAWLTRSVALGVVVLGALAQYLPWTTVGRVTFLYHYLPVVPFLALALGWTLAVGIRERSTSRRTYHRWRGWDPVIAPAVVSAAAVAVFLVMLPMLEGWAVSSSLLDAARKALPWVLP